MVVALAWGSNVPVVKVGLQEMSPFFYVFLRFVILFCLMLPFMRWRTGRFGRLVGVGLFLGPVHFGVLFYGMDMVADASVAAVLTQLTAPFATILAVVMLGERIGIWRTGGLVLAFLGVAVMMFEPRVFDDVLGVGLLMFSAFAYAFGAILVRRVGDVSVFELQGVMALVSLPILLGLTYVFETGQAVELAAMTWKGWGALFYTAVIASAFGHGLSYYLFQRNPVSAVAPFFLLTPVFGVIASVLLLDEVLTARMIAGAAIIFSGIAVVTLRERHKAMMTNRALIKEAT
ncbi:MAG: DMT family transporter [Sphingomonadales bacterium]